MVTGVFPSAHKDLVSLCVLLCTFKIIIIFFTPLLSSLSFSPVLPFFLSVSLSLVKILGLFLVFFFLLVNAFRAGEGNNTPLQYSCLEKSHGRRCLVGYNPRGCKESTRPSDFTFTFHFHALEKEMATHSSVLAWRPPGTEEPGGLSMGLHRVGHN